MHLQNFTELLTPHLILSVLLMITHALYKHCSTTVFAVHNSNVTGPVKMDQVGTNYM